MATAPAGTSSNPQVLTVDEAEQLVLLAKRYEKQQRDLKQKPELADDILRKGVKTSEFWMIAGICLLISFGPEFGLNLTTQQIDTLIWLAGIYTGGRAAPKVASIVRKKMNP